VSGACWRWLAPKLPSTVDDDRSNYWPAWEVTAKAVERTAEAIGADIAAGDQREIQRALQLNLPTVMSSTAPILYVEIDRTGVPVVKAETEGRLGKVKGEPAHTREAKLGSVFTQTTWDQKGHAIRDPDTTTYVAAIETASEFGPRIYLEAWNRSWERAEKKVVIGDGAEWIWYIADDHFPGAIQIVDIFHARQHLWDVVRKLYPGCFELPTARSDIPPRAPSENASARWARAPASAAA
jgi:hypothetical protein